MKKTADQRNAGRRFSKVGTVGRYARKSVEITQWRKTLDLARKSRRKKASAIPRTRELGKGETRQILEAAGEAESVTGISRQLGIRRATVRKVLQQHGVPMPDGRGVISEETKVQLRRLAGEGVSRDRLAREFGVSKSSIFRVLAVQ